MASFNPMYLNSQPLLGSFNLNDFTLDFFNGMYSKASSIVMDSYVSHVQLVTTVQSTVMAKCSESHVHQGIIATVDRKHCVQVERMAKGRCLPMNVAMDHVCQVTTVHPGARVTWNTFVVGHMSIVPWGRHFLS